MTQHQGLIAAARELLVLPIRADGEFAERWKALAQALAALPPDSSDLCVVPRELLEEAVTVIDELAISIGTIKCPMVVKKLRQAMGG